MTRFFGKFFVIFLSIALVSCGEGGSRPSRSNKRGQAQKAVFPTKGAKIAFIFPAGAGAMRASLAVTEKLESDLGLKGLGSVIDVAGGVSSGSLVAAALTYGDPPKITSRALKNDIGSLVRKVFPDTNRLVDQMINDYNFSLDELEHIFVEISKAPPDLTSAPSAETDLEKILGKAIGGKLSIKRKIDAKGTITDFITNIKPNLALMVNKDAAQAAALGTVIQNILGDVPLSDPNVNKFIAFATGDKKPVFFGPQRFASFVNGPFAVSTTMLSEALISSSAIPHFIKAPATINFTDGGAVRNIPDLSDGFFATEGRFDPSATFYEIFTKLFAGEELLIVYVGNGAPYDQKFRNMLRSKYGFDKRISQQLLANGNKVTYAAIDTKIVDDKDNNLFNLSGFYGNSRDLDKYMDKAGEQATKSAAYTWVLDALKAVR